MSTQSSASSKNWCALSGQEIPAELFEGEGFIIFRRGFSAACGIDDGLFCLFGADPEADVGVAHEEEVAVEDPAAEAEWDAGAGVFHPEVVNGEVAFAVCEVGHIDTDACGRLAFRFWPQGLRRERLRAGEENGAERVLMDGGGFRLRRFGFTRPLTRGHAGVVGAGHGGGASAEVRRGVCGCGHRRNSSGPCTGAAGLGFAAEDGGGCGEALNERTEVFAEGNGVEGLRISDLVGEDFEVALEGGADGGGRVD